MLVLGLNLAQSPTSIFHESGWCCTGHRHSPASPAALPETAERHLVPFAEQGKARAGEMPSSEPNNSAARQRKTSGIKSILPASPLIDGEPGVLALPCSGFGGVRHSSAPWHAITARKKEGADRPGRGKNESQPPFIRTPPSAACRSLFLSLLIKAKRFLLPQLKPGAPASHGRHEEPAGCAEQGMELLPALRGTTPPRRPSSSETASWRQIFMYIYIYTHSSAAFGTQRKVSVGTRLMGELPQLS